jgi:glucose/mannose-6-phosphate isomerase
MEEQLRQFPSQFAWEPSVVGTIPAFTRAIVCGMGGSALQARLLHGIDPTLPFTLHQDYGLPYIVDGEAPLIILSSYSGDTEEVLASAHDAMSRGLPSAVVASGGALLEVARTNNLPYIELPTQKMEPRMAIGLAMLALLRILGAKEQEAKLRAAGSALDVTSLLATGSALAPQLQNRLPLVYASTPNAAVAYFWKIALNETTKIPAFTNVVPELCHNELSGFDMVPATSPLSQTMTGIFLHDAADYPRDEKRLTLVADLMREKGLSAVRVDLPNADAYTKTLSGVLVGAATALTLAHAYGVRDADVPLIEDFKKRMQT